MLLKLAAEGCFSAIAASFNTHDLLESIAKISKKQPDEACEIWLKMLEGSSMDFPEEAVRAALLIW